MSEQKCVKCGHSNVNHHGVCTYEIPHPKALYGNYAKRYCGCKCEFSEAAASEGVPERCAITCHDPSYGSMCKVAHRCVKRAGHNDAHAPEDFAGHDGCVAEAVWIEKKVYGFYQRVSTEQPQNESEWTKYIRSSTGGQTSNSTTVPDESSQKCVKCGHELRFSDNEAGDWEKILADSERCGCNCLFGESVSFSEAAASPCSPCGDGDTAMKYHNHSAASEGVPPERPDWKYALSMALPDEFPDDLLSKMYDVLEPYFSPSVDDLEWAAQWIEGSLKGETNERVIEFGRNMAMTLRAALISQHQETKKGK